MSNLKARSIQAMAYNTEKLRNVTLHNFKLSDSLSFIQGSLSDLVDNLSAGSGRFSVLDQMKLWDTPEQRKLLLRKGERSAQLLDQDTCFYRLLGVFPYDYASSIDRLKSTPCIPKKEEFFNTLTDSHISDEDYEHAKTVFRKFDCKNMLDYMMLYMECDTYLLADVFINFRKTMHEKFGLDPAYYISLPSYGFESMLRLTQVQLDYIYDMDVYLFLSQNIRGGLSFVGNRLASAKDENGEEIRSILYYDVNNL